jgi:hypothetical protein
MVDSDKRKQYQTRYGTFSDSGDNIPPNGQVMVDNVDAEGQITSLKVYSDVAVEVSVSVDKINNGEDAVPFTPGVTTEGSPTEKFNLAGNSEYNVGDFENPVIEVGARNQAIITINNTGDFTSSEQLAVNVRVDEHLG